MKKSLRQVARRTNKSYQSRMKNIHIVGLFVVPALILVFSHLAQRTKVNASAGETTPAQVLFDRAVMSERISVHAAGRGNPSINLKDGRDLLTAFSGPAELTSALEQNQVRPLSLCSADYDEDGVPDLVSGYAGPSGGIITLLRGNVDSIYPNTPEAKQRRAAGTFTEAPFLSPALVFAVPEAPDFLGGGDFDNDGHWDVVVGARGSDKLYLFASNGEGSFGPPKQIELAGEVTAMVAGEINRPDGLDDVVVGISGPDGAKALVFEGPKGALRGSPEIFDLPAEARSFALGQLDGEYYRDLAVAAGHELMVVHGRDRKLSLNVEKQAKVAKARLSKRSFASEIVSLATGDFTGNDSTDLAVLSGDGAVRLLTTGSRVGRVTKRIADWQSEVVAQQFSLGATQLVRVRTPNNPFDALIVVGSKSKNLQILTTATTPALLDVQSDPVAVLPMRLNEDALKDLVILTSERGAPSVVATAPTNRFIVTNTNDKGVGSLRAAILNANSSSGAVTISFDIPGSGIPTIRPQRGLPAISHAVTIDGTTQPAGLVEIDGTDAGGDNNGLDIRGGNSVVRGMVINSFRPNKDPMTATAVLPEGYAGISLTSKGGNVIEGNYIGPDETGRQTANLELIGIMIFGSSDNLIGGTVPAARNIVSGNEGANITITTLRRHAESCCIPVHEFVNLETTRNKVQGNFIGTDVTGTRIVAAGDFGFPLFPNYNGIGLRDGSFGNVVGGTEPGAGNLISGCFSNLEIFDSTGNLVQGNFIGTDFTGTTVIDRLVGNSPHSSVSLSGITSTSTIATLLSEDPIAAISFLIDSTRSGVIIADPEGPTFDNTIGGTTVNARNLIADAGTGIEIVNTQSTGNQIQGNFIGTDVYGNLPLGNGLGISVANAPDTIIGGSEVGARNVISGNGTGIYIGFGQVITFSPSGEMITQTFIGQRGATVQGNYIGTDQSGVSELGNNRGIYVETNSLINNIEGNLIAFNGNGIKIPNSTENGTVAGFSIAILSNTITANLGLGIDLADDNAVTANDPLDADPGANRLQNFPVLNSAISSNGSLTVSGTLNSEAMRNYRLEFFVGSACSSQNQLLGSVKVLGSNSVTTDGSGNASYSFSFTLPAGFATGLVNATATDQDGNTSEFSQCRAVS